MITPALWILISLQILMGAFDTLYHHELIERLPWRATQSQELRLHGARNFIYAGLFLALAWVEPRGLWAAAMGLALAVELLLTLADFVEEDSTRALPASERVTHTLLALNYGAILALLAPALIDRLQRPTGAAASLNGGWSLLATGAALGVLVFGIRDSLASARALHRPNVQADELARVLPRHRRVLVTGATGFIGERLVTALATAGHQVTALARDPAKAARVLAPPYRVVTSLDQLGSGEAFDAIVNLAGEPISDGLWTRRKRRRILASRLRVTGEVVRLIARLEQRPDVLVSGSAVGWYGMRGDEPLDEASTGAPCFSHRLCASWEAAARRAEAFGVRVVLLRTGLVLAREGGLLARLLTPFEFGLGGPIGSGRQWMPWIERDDCVRLILHALATPKLSGPVNAVAPRPVTNAEFTTALGRTLRRPAVLRAPGWLLRRLGGGMARELLLSGQRVLPSQALASGFRFKHEDLDSALATIIQSQDTPHVQQQFGPVRSPAQVRPAIAG